MKFLKGVGQFWYDFLIGDDAKIAAAVAVVLAIGTLTVLGGGYDSKILTPLLAVGVAAGFTAMLLIDVRKKN
ncbi:MAG: hypothetical protein M3018_05040 [Actinomycetota bacterium]|nr:hypothetical protein [Actinomycetota bacterium]